MDYVIDLSLSKFINTNSELFTIIPIESNFICTAYLPTQSFSKIQIAQKVRIKVDNYPYQEFGQLIGKVEAYSATHTNEGYRVKITLPNGLLSSYKKRIDYLPEMNCQAEVITEELSILERIFNNFRSLIDKNNN